MIFVPSVIPVPELPILDGETSLYPDRNSQTFQHFIKLRVFS